MSRTILIIDDSKFERTFLRGLLRADYTIVEAAGGEEALTIIQERFRAISAIVLDVVMPEMDGYETLKRIKANAVWHQIPVIMATGMDDDVEREKAIALGADNFVTKPYSRALLLHALQNAIMLRESAAIANTMWRDGLTGLLNRDSFLTEAERRICERAPGYYILSCVDIENFKVINDQYGADKGDDVLRHISGCLRELAAGEDGLACRYTADKFAVLMPAARKDADEVFETHRRAMLPEGVKRPVRIRIGRYLATDLSLPVSAMYDRASIAELSLRGKYDIYIADYSEAMRSHILREQQIVNDMTDALKNGEFQPWFQPQYNHSTGALIGAEALARWIKGEELIAPDSFIPVFEKNGFIYEVDQAIWKQVCVCLRRWLDEGRKPLPVSVNISRYDLQQKDFLSVIRTLIKTYRLPAELLRLEITESAFADSADGIINVVNQLVSEGFTVEIDDFGSGYSSLSTLKDVPASILKLDMRFFACSKNTRRGGNIVESVVRMAKWLGMAIIAEGVEDKKQADYLKTIGCSYIQGYCYARPMTASDFEKLLDESGKEPKLAKLKTLETLDNNEFWDPKSMDTLIFNSYAGAACILEYSKGGIEMLRASDCYVKMLGNGMRAEEALRLDWASHMDNNSLSRFSDDVMQSMETNAAVTGEYEFLELPGCHHRTYLRSSVRVIATIDDRSLVYCLNDNITAQKEAERMQREAEEKQLESARKLEVIMSNVNGGVSAILINDDGTSRFVFSNEKYYTLYGYTREQAENERLDVMSRVLPEDLPAVMEKVRKLKKDKIPAIIDFRISKKDGTLAYLRANSSLMYMDGCGDVITSVITDITEKRLLEDQLRAIVDNIYGGVSATVLRNGAPEFLIVNNKFFEILGYQTREEFESACGNDKYACIHPEDRESIVQKLDTSDGGRRQYSMEYRIIRKDGVVRYILNNISIIKLFGIEGPIRLSVINDLTEQRMAELKAHEAADKLNAVLSHAGNGITAVVLREGAPEFLFSNDRYFDMIGYSKEEFALATKSDLLAPIHPADRERIRAATALCVQDSGNVTLEYRLRRMDGSVIWIRCILTMTRLLGIDAPVQIGIYSDITAEREKSDQLRFLNDSAHDILAQPDSEQAIKITLHKIIHYFSADRSYVVELDNIRKLSGNTYEVCAEGVTSEMDKLQELPFKDSDFWYRALSCQDYLKIEDVAKLDDSSPAERKMLLEQNIRSMLLAPLRRDGRLIGFLGVDNPSRAIDQLGQLTALADYISILLTRRDLNRRIEREHHAMQVLIDDTPDGFVRMEIHPGANPTIVSLNSGMCRMLNMTRDEVMAAYGRDARGFFTPENIADASEKAAAALAACGQYSCKCRLHRKGGETLWVIVYGRFVKDDEGRIYLNSHFTDISDQKKAEEQQKELLDNLPCGAALYEYDGKSLAVIHINKSYWELVGREPADYSTASVFGGIHKDDRAIVHQEVEAAIRQGRNAEVDFRVLCGDAKYRPMHAAARIVPKTSGSYLLYTSYTPISDKAMSVQEMLPVALSTLMSASEELSYVKDKDLHYLCCSQAVANLLGIASQRELVGKNAHDVFEKKLADKFDADDREILLSGRPIIDMTESIPLRNGGTRLVSTSKYPILDASGNVIGVYGTSRDITAQREKESQLALLTNSIPGGIAVYEGKPEELDKIKLVYFSDGFCRLYGYTREQYEPLAKRNPLGLVLEEDLAKLYVQIDALIKKGKPLDYVYRANTSDNARKWINIKAVMGEPNGDRLTVNAVVFDVTEQKTAEEKLRVSEQINRLAIEQSKNIVCRYDVATKRLSVSPNVNQIFRQNAVEENVPYQTVLSGKISPNTEKAYIEFYEGILHGEKTGAVLFQKTSTIGWRWIEAHFTSIFAESGKPSAAVISYADVTERMEKETVYKRWRQSLCDRAPESYSLYRCNISKNTVIGAAEGLLTSPTDEPEETLLDLRTYHYAKKWVYADDRQSFLSALDCGAQLKRFEQGARTACIEYREKQKDGAFRWLKLTVELVESPSSTDIEGYLLFEDINDAKRAELEMISRAETDPLTGILNRAAFAKKADALIRSSGRHKQHALLMMDVDGFKLVNDVFGHAAGDRTLIEIAGELRKQLRRGDLVGRLGGDEFVVFLADIPGPDIAAKIARQICRSTRKTFRIDVRISASVGIAVCPRDGSCFDALYASADSALYRVKDSGKDSYAFSGGERETIEADKREKAAMEAAEQSTGAKRRMLIVDDSKIDQMLLYNLFKDQFIIEEAPDGASALMKLRHYGQEISIVLLDLMMPGMDGFEVLAKMRQSAGANMIPVVVVSANDDPEIGLKAIRAGAADLVTKPIDFDILRIRVEAAISKAENERLRVQNGLLYLQNREACDCKALLDRMGMLVISLDWKTGVFAYSPAVQKTLSGSYDGRTLWDILATDGVAERETVQEMRSAAQKLAEDENCMEESVSVLLKDVSGKKQRYEMSLYKLNGDNGSTYKLLLTLRQK